jgi:vacuolar-type H+-ATPase subunit H
MARGVERRTMNCDRNRSDAGEAASETIFPLRFCDERFSSMKTSFLFSLAALGLIAVGCEQTPADKQAEAVRNATQNQAEEVREGAQNQAENVRDAADNVGVRAEDHAEAVESAGERKADAIEESGEKKAEAIEDAGVPAPTPTVP